MLLQVILAAALSTSLPNLHQADEAELRETLIKKRDDADAALLLELAKFKTAAAAEGLVDVYDSMSSLFMRLETLKALAKLDGAAEAEQSALQKIMDVATNSEERELREGAIAALGKCPSKGRAFLRMIVESPAIDEVREDAMYRHVRLSSSEDHAWYRELYEDDGKRAPADGGGRSKKRRGRKDEDEPKELKIHQLPVVRELAFEALAPKLESKELIEAVKDRTPAIRRISLKHLGQKDARDAKRYAEESFGNLSEFAPNRIVAAEILMEVDGIDVSGEFIDVAEAFITPMELRLALADLLISMNDEKLNKRLAKKVGKGKTHEKLFYLRVARGLEDPKLTKTIARMLKDKEASVALAAADALAARKDPGAKKDLESALKKAKDPLMVTACLRALDGFLSGDEEWEAALSERLSEEDAIVRNAALAVLAARGKAHLEPLYAALSHADWSTRLAALKLLEELRVPASVGKMIAQMESEEGRMSHEFAEVLFNLTGQPFRTRWGNWHAWWQDSGDGFKPISTSELRKRRKEEEERRLRMVSGVKFFGIRIVSHRVAFIIDVSGSMNEPTRAQYIGEQGEPRMSLAQRELKKCIDALDSKALFNIVTFSGGVEPWLDEGVEDSGERSREEAKGFVDKLGAMGGTNLYGALRHAFEDPEVDTIFVLSDGEPSVGDVLDPFEIRAHVKRWNKDREIVINSIAVGGSFQILEWIAEDSGGTHVRFD
jgi:hypothetical protein